MFYSQGYILGPKFCLVDSVEIGSTGSQNSPGLVGLELAILSLQSLVKGLWEHSWLTLCLSDVIFVAILESTLLTLHELLDLMPSKRRLNEQSAL